MATQAEVREFLSKHDYLIKVKQVDNGCDLYFPNKIYSPKPDVSLAKFRAKTGKYSGLYCNDTFAPAPEYALKLLMACYILKWAMQVKYSTKLIILIDKEGEELPIGGDITEIIDIELSPDQKEKEKKLIGVFAEYLVSGLQEDFEDIADEYELKEGFVLARRIFLENDK